MSIVKGRDPVSQLYRAVERYVAANGGALLVVGGIQMQQWPGEGAATFSIAVKCTGRKPVFKPVSGARAARSGPPQAKKERAVARAGEKQNAV